MPHDWVDQQYNLCAIFPPCSTKVKKSHTSEEDGAHLRISFWDLLMNFEKPKKSEF